MPRTIENILECHRVAAKRRASGKPVWDRTINIKAVLNEDRLNTSDEHAAQVANRIGALVRKRVPAGWLELGAEADFELIEIVEGMETLKPDGYAGENGFTPLDDLNNMLDGLYDWANAKRVWLGH